MEYTLYTGVYIGVPVTIQIELQGERYGFSPRGIYLLVMTTLTKVF